MITSNAWRSLQWPACNALVEHVVQVSHYKVLINNLEHATVDAHSWDLLQHLPSTSKFQMRVAACSAVLLHLCFRLLLWCVGIQPR